MIQFLDGTARFASLMSIPTCLGDFRAVFDNDDALMVLDFPTADPNAAVGRIVGEVERFHPGCRISLSKKSHSPIASQLPRFLSGDIDEFHLQVRPGKVPDFCLSVWKKASEIEYGQTISYGELARRTGNSKASRAVGSALGRNPIPIVIPCHRILEASGGLGGFSGGLDWKQRLLDLEKALRPIT